jgi:hypothetical protein
MKRYPGLFTWAEIHALPNLRGIPEVINNDLHLSLLNRAWNNFYLKYPNASRELIESYVNFLDRWFGHQFLPPI